MDIFEHHIVQRFRYTKKKSTFMLNEKLDRTWLSLDRGKGYFNHKPTNVGQIALKRLARQTI